MKTLLFIITVALAILLTQRNKLREERLDPTAVSMAHIDSVLEVGRIQAMKNKFMQMQ